MDDAQFPPDSEMFFDINGVEHCDNESALSILLRDEVLLSNERETLYDGKPAGSTVVLYVLCNDVFAWGCSDAEDLPHQEIGRLYRMHRDDPIHGATKWCCLRRNERPQMPIERRWREKGIWDAAMEALPLNVYEANMAKARETRP